MFGQKHWTLVDPAKDGFNYNIPSKNNMVLDEYMASTASIAHYIGYSKGLDKYTRLWYEFYYDALLGAT